MENIITKSETQLCRIFDGFPAAVYVCDQNGLITYFNERAAETWGFQPCLGDSAESLSSVYKLRTIDGERMGYAESWMGLGLARKRAYHDEEIILERPDGSFRTLLVYVTPRHDGSNLHSGTINVLVDITRIKHAERILRQTNEVLESQVAERTRALALAKEKAENSEEAKSQFLGMISHDLRTPLSGILIAVKTLTSLEKQISAEKRIDLLRQIEACVHDQVAFVDDLVTLARYEDTGTDDFRSGLRLEEILGTAIRAVSIQADNKNIGLLIGESQTTATIRGDRRQLVHLFTNLLSNAIKFTPSGGTVRVSLAETSGHICASVADTGIGFEAGQVETFHRAGTVRQRRGTSQESGSGLGLRIVRRVAKMHDAKVILSSQSGQGSCFTLQFPKIPPADSSVFTAPKRGKSLSL